MILHLHAVDFFSLDKFVDTITNIFKTTDVKEVKVLFKKPCSDSYYINTYCATQNKDEIFYDLKMQLMAFLNLVL